VTINLGWRLPATSSGQPEDRPGVLMSSYLALLRVGFAQPTGHPAAGELLPHHFTLTPKSRGGVFLWHFPSGCPAWALPSTLPGGARTFLTLASYMPERDHPDYWANSIVEQDGPPAKLGARLVQGLVG
jgi:hypothetical protein